MPRSKQPKDERILLATVTGEPFVPVRLYWSIPAKTVVKRVFSGLRCMDEDDEAHCWVWLYEHEAAGLTFLKRRADLPPGVHPIVIGRFRMPTTDRLVMELRSFERATEAAKFFAPRFGPSVVLQRIRVINRWFEAPEAAAGLDHLDSLLDANVVTVDPQDAEKAIEAALAGAHTPEEKRRAFMQHYEKVRRQDVPLVEDFPLVSEEETPDFQHLTMTLRFRGLRAFEHWKGNTQLTLADVIERAVGAGPAASPSRRKRTGPAKPKVSKR